MVSWTVFVSGDSYNGGRFSTRWGNLDTVSGALAGTLESFTVDGRAAPSDANLWASPSPGTTTPSTPPCRRATGVRW